MKKTNRTRTRSLPTPVVGITGFEGSGKSNFLTTAPKRLAIVGTDTNTESALCRAFGVDSADDLPEDEVTFKALPMPSVVFDDRDDVKSEAEERAEELVDFLRPLIKGDEDERPRTLALDTAVDVYDLHVLGMFGKLDQIPPELRKNMMGRCNTAYKGIVQAAKNKRIAVLLVHRAKELWADKTRRTQAGIQDVREKLTGPFDMERDGFKGTGFLTSVEVHLAFDPNRDVKDGLSEKAALAAKFGMKVVRCSDRPGLIGREFWGRHKLEDGTRIPKASFPFLMAQVYPFTTIEDWM